MWVTLLAFTFLTLSFAGCGDSRENFVFTGNQPVAQTGTLTFNFINPQAPFVAPTGTTRVRFDLFTGPNGTGTLDETRTENFAPTIVLANVSPDVESTVITYFNGSGIPVGQSVVSTPVVAGQNLVVDSTGANTSVPAFDSLVATPETLSLGVDETGQIQVVGNFASGDAVSLTGNTAAGITYTPADPTIATVSNQGVVTGESVGNTQITVSLTANGTLRSDTVNVEVRQVTGFESSEGFTADTSINGQEGWRATEPTYDQEVADVSDFRTEGAFSIFGEQALRISNAVENSEFDGWVYAPPLDDKVGESAAVGNLPAGTRYNTLDIQFDIATTKTTHQPNLQVSMAPNPGNEDRMSFLRFEDRVGGMAVVFFDYQPDEAPDVFVSTDAAVDLSRDVPHNIRMVFTAVEGAENDVVEVYVDGVLEHTGGSWEEYYREDAEPTPPDEPRLVNTIILQARGNGTFPLNLGQGFLFDNLSISAYDSVAE